MASNRLKNCTCGLFSVSKRGGPGPVGLFAKVSPGLPINLILTILKPTNFFYQTAIGISRFFLKGKGKCDKYYHRDLNLTPVL